MKGCDATEVGSLLVYEVKNGIPQLHQGGPSLLGVTGDYQKSPLRVHIQDRIVGRTFKDAGRDLSHLRGQTTIA